MPDQIDLAPCITDPRIGIADPDGPNPARDEDLVMYALATSTPRERAFLIQSFVIGNVLADQSKFAPDLFRFIDAWVRCS